MEVEQMIGEMTPLICDCGSRKFKVVTEQIVNDVFNLDGQRAWTSDNELTIERERYIEVVCVKCGKILVESYHEKPIPKRAWDEFWAGHITDFIIGFEHYAVNRELSNEDTFMAFLEGMAHGMWTLERLIEAEMVQDKVVKGKRKRYVLYEAVEAKRKKR